MERLLTDEIVIPPEFSDDWQPNELLVRTKYIDQIIHALKDYAFIYLNGEKGIGKTLLTKFICQSFPTSIYIKCQSSFKEALRHGLELEECKEKRKKE